MADRRKPEEIIEDVRSGVLDLEDAADELEREYGKTALRQQAGRVPELERERDEVKAELDKLKKAPIRDTAFAEYGVDFASLRPAERKALETYDGELDAEHIAEFVQEYDLPLTEKQPPESGTQPEAGKIAAAARQATGAARPGQGLQITPADVTGWSGEKWLRFKEQHAAEAEDILQGKTVSGIAFA
jgi:hypothetical protein